MSGNLESFVARGRHPRNVVDQRETSFGLAELSTNRSLHERLVKKGGIETLASLLDTCQDVESQQFAALAIANTASTTTLCREIAKLDGVLEVLVTYVGNEDGDPIGKQYCAMALGNILAEPDNRELIVKLGCITSLITMLKYCSDGRQLESGTYAAFAISNISSNYSYHQQIVNEGGIELLVSLACCDDGEAQRYALLSLRGLCGTKDNRCMVLQKGILDPLILLSRSSEKGIVEEVSCILNCLSSEEQNKEEISYRAMSTLIGLLMSGDDEVERHSCSAVANLLELFDTHARFIEECGLPPLVALCSSLDDSCRREALRALSNLSFNRDLIQALVEENALCPLVKGVDKGKCRFATLAIANIATHAQMVLKIVQVGAISPLVTLVSTRGSGDAYTEARRFGALALTNITTFEAFQSDTIEAGILDALFALSNSSDAESKHYVAKSFANLSSNFANHDLIADKSGLQCIVSLANEPSPEIHRYAVAALWGLSASSKLKTKIVNEGGLGALHRLLPTSVKDQQLLHDITACLCNLSYEKQNSFEMTRSGVVATLMSCMESDDSTIASYACECLANLSEVRENQNFLAGTGVIQLCKGAMCSRHTTIQRGSGRLSANLSGSSDLLASDIIVQDGIHLLLMSFLLSKDATCQKIGSVGIGNLCTNDCHREALMESGVLEPLISLVRSEKSDIESRRFSMLAIANLAASFATHDGILAQGTIAMLISFSNSSDFYLKDYAAFALAELSRNSNMTKFLASEGALEPVLALLDQKCGDKCVERQLLPAIKTLSFLDRNKVPICASESLGVILSFINDCSCSDDEVQLACCTLANLVEFECNMEVAVNAGCIPLLIGKLRSDSEVMQSECARALGNLASKIEFCNLLLENEVTQLLFSCHRQMTNESRRMTAFALSNLSSNINSHPHLAALDVMGWIASECSTALHLKQFSDHETLRFCILVLANLSGSNQSQTLTESLFDMLMKLTQHRDVKCREHAVLALGNLCTNPNHVKRLIDVKCADALVAYSFPTSAEDSVNTQFQAIAGLHGLSKHAELRYQLLCQGGLEPLILGARGGSDGSSIIEIQRESAAALNNMAMAKENRTFMAKSGALPALKELLKNEDSICHIHASSALANLAESNSGDVHKLLLDDNCLDIMCRHAISKDSHIEMKGAISRCLALVTSCAEDHEHLMSSNVLKSLEVLISDTNDIYCERYGIMAIANLATVESNHEVVLSAIEFDTIFELVESDDIETRRVLSFVLHLFSKFKQNHALLEDSNVVHALGMLLGCSDYDTSFQACLAAKYLCTSENWQSIIAESNCLEILFSLASKCDLELKRELAGTLRNMSLSYDKKKIMLDNDGMNTITALCRDSDSIVSHQACGTLANILERHENKVVMVKQGIIHHLQYAMRVTNDIAVVRESMRAFANLSSASETIPEILTSGTLALIVDLLRCGDILSSRYAAMFMSNLARVKESRQKIVQDGKAIQLLLALIQQADTNRTDSLAQQHAMACLSNLASCHSLQNDLILKGCTQILIDHISSTDLKLRSCALLYVANLASNATSRTILEEWCITKDLIDCLKCTDRLVKIHALSALRGLSASSSICDEIISCGGFGNLLSFVRSDDLELKHDILLTLCNLSISGTMSDQANTILQEVDMQSLIGFLCDETLTSHRIFGATTIGNIASNIDLHGPILDSGALTSLIGISELNDSDIESQRSMALAICNLAWQPASRSAIISNGGLSSIMYLCNALNPNDMLCGLSSLRALSTSDDSRRAIFEEGILHVLLLGLKVDCLDCKREIASILALLSLNDRNKIDLARSDEIKEFMCLLEVGDSHCISLMCRCIGSICEVNEHHPTILSICLLKRLASLISDLANPTVVKEVARCYANLSSNFDTHNAIVTSSVIKNLKSLCSYNDVDVRHLSLLSLSNISANENMELKGEDAVLCALRNIIDYDMVDSCSSCSEEDENQKLIGSKCCACMAIGSLISADNSVAKQIVDTGIIPSLLQLLTVENDQLSICAVYLVDKLSLSEDTHQDLHKHCIIPHLMKYYQHRQRNLPNVLTYIVGVIRNLCANKSTDVKNLMPDRVVPFLAETCDFDNLECCRQMVSGMCHLVLRNDARYEVVKSNKMMKCLLGLSNLSDIDISRFALGSIANICEDSRYYRAIVDEPNIVASLILYLNSEHVSIVRESIRMVVNLLSLKEFQSEFLKKGGMTPIVRISQSHDHECVCNAALALRKLAANKACHAILFSDDGVASIIRLVDHIQVQVQIHSAAALRDISSNDDYKIAISRSGIIAIALKLASKPETESKVFAMGILRHLSVTMKTELMDYSVVRVLSDCVDFSDNEALFFECALFVASLAEHAQNKVALVQMGILRRLVTLSKCKSARVRRNSARAFALLSATVNHDEFVGSILEVLIELLQCQDEETCSDAAATLANVATNEDVSARIGILGGIDALTLLLKRPSVICQANSCRALSRLTVVVEENKSSIFLHGGIDRLVQLCVASKDAEVSCLATMVLCNLTSCPMHENDFVREDLLQSLNRIALGNCPVSRQYAIMVLCNLTSMCRLRDLVAREVSLSQLFGLVKEATVDCSVYIAMLICNLASVEKHRAAILTAGGLSCLESVIVNADDGGDDYVDLKRASLLCLYNLSACDESHTMMIARSSLMQYIVLACRSRDLLCQRCALMTLSNIACNDWTRPIAMKGGGLQTAILSLMEDDTTVQRLGLVCLTNMSNDNQTQSQIAVHGGFQPIINLSREGSSRETRECAFLCLSNLCANESAAVEVSLVKEAALVANNACREHLGAAFAIANLTSRVGLIHDIGGEVIQHLIALSNSGDIHDQCLAFSALGRMASQTENRDVLLNILPALANANRINREQPEVRLEIAFCLCGLSKSSSYRLSMARVTISMLIEFSRRSIDCTTVSLILNTVANIAEDINTHPILINANILDEILHRLSHTESSIKREAARAVANLLSSKGLHPTFIRQGLSGLVQLQASSCADCDYLAALSISKLSVTVGSIPALVDNALKYILSLIKANGIMTRKHAAIALRNVSARSEEKDVFFKLGIPTLMVEVLSGKETDLDVLVAATLRSLSCSKCVVDNLLESGILHCVTRSIPNASIDLKVEIAATLGNLSEHVECQPIMISHGAVRAIGALSAVNNHHEGIWRDCARALANLCSAEKKQHIVFRQGGFKIIKNLSYSNSDEIKRYVAIAMRFMAKENCMQRQDNTKMDEQGGEDDDVFSLYLDMSDSDSLDYQRSASASLASLSQTEEGRLIIMKHGGISAILRLCGHQDVCVRRSAIYSVANLAAIPDIRQYIAIDGGVEVIRSASALNCDIEFLRDSARSLSTLAVDIAIKEVMVFHDVPKALSKLAKSVDNETQRFASLALSNLCTATRNEKETILKQDMLRIISFLLRYPDLEVERRASLAIAALSLGSDENRMAMVDHGFVRSLLEATSYPDLKLRHCALLALNALTLSTDPKPKQRIVEENGLSSLQEILRSCTDDESLHACIYLLGSLAEDADILNVTVDMSLLPLIVQKLEDGSIETKRSAAYFLALLSESQECHDRMNEAGALEAITAITSLVDEECQYYGAFALALLAKNKSFQVPLTKMGGVRPLVSIMATHSEARHWAALALLKLADNFNNHMTIADEGGIQALLQLRGEHGAGVTVANLAKRAFKEEMKKWKSI